MLLSSISLNLLLTFIPGMQFMSVYETYDVERHTFRWGNRVNDSVCAHASMRPNHPMIPVVLELWRNARSECFVSHCYDFSIMKSERHV